MLVNPYAFGTSGGGGSTDPDFANVGLLVHMGASFVDSSSNALGLTTTGSPILNSVDQQVGTGCSDFATPAGGSTASSFFSVNAGAGGPVDLSAGPYTVEIWQYQRASSAYIVFGTTYNNHVMLLPTGGSGQLHIEGSDRGIMTIPLNQWNHIAVVMDGSDMVTGYVNGIQQFAPVSVARGSWGGETWYMGGSQFGAALEGLAQEFRITKGVARYTANFTPPVAPFPNS